MPATADIKISLEVDKILVAPKYLELARASFAVTKPNVPIIADTSVPDNQVKIFAWTRVDDGAETYSVFIKTLKLPNA